MKKLLKDFDFSHRGNNLYIIKKNLDYMVVTNVYSGNLDKTISLFKRMIELDRYYYTLTFEEMNKRYSINNQNKFSKCERKTYSIDGWDKLRPVC